MPAAQSTVASTPQATMAPAIQPAVAQAQEHEVLEVSQPKEELRKWNKSATSIKYP